MIDGKIIITDPKRGMMWESDDIKILNESIAEISVAHK